MEIIDGKKLSLFRRYYLEVSIFFLTACLGFTVNFVIDLNKTFVKYIMEDKQTTTIQVQKSTDALNNNTEALRDIKEMRQELYKKINK